MEDNDNTQDKGIAVAYIRLSADDSKNPSLSPANQEKIIDNFAKAKGDKIKMIYRDINRTGSNLERPAFQDMLRDLKQGNIKKIYIKDWSRLTRDIADLRDMRKQIEDDLGIEIVSADGVKDDKAIDITTLANDWFVKDCKKKQEQVHALKLQKQIPLTRPPFGYKMSRRYKMYFPDTNKAEILKQIFQMRVKGLSICAIARKFKMNATTVYNLLSNRTFLGESKYKGVWSKAKHEPLIDEETFYKVQTKTDKKRHWINPKKTLQKQVM